MKILPGQCKKTSRNVKEEDMEKVKSLAEGMIELCRQELGIYPYAYAIAHCQIDHDDPMRFFVGHHGRLIINPKIEPIYEDTSTELEGCYSYPYRPPKKVKRFKEVFVEYTEVEANGKTKKKKKKLDGMQSRVFQHEIDHFNGIHIYR